MSHPSQPIYKTQRYPFWRRLSVSMELTFLLTIASVFGLLAAGQLTKLGLAHQAPPPGMLVDVGGYRLHLDCRGPVTFGQPTIVLEAGLGEWSLTWAGLMPLLAERHRVCAYDRAGYGWSESRPGAPTAAAIVADLYTLLQHSGEPGPFVMVGHSLGALYVRFFTDQHPEAVTGLVLIDPSHEEMTTRLPLEWQQQLAGANQERVSALRIQIALVDLGIAALFPAIVPPADARLPAATRTDLRMLHLMNSQALHALSAEISASDAILAEARAARLGTLGARPLVVISAGTVGEAAPDDLVPSTPSFDLHQDLAELSSRGLRIKLGESGHYAHYDQPLQVVDAIEWVMAQVAQAQP